MPLEGGRRPGSYYSSLLNLDLPHIMYEDNIFKRFPRHDTDFTMSDDKSYWFQGRDTVSWVETAIAVLWIAGILALIFYTCSHSANCPLYMWLSKFRQEPRHDFVERWVVNQGGLQGRDSHQSSSLPLLEDSPPSSRRFSDPPPEYSQVVGVGKCDPPPYSSVSSIPQVAVIIPDREWTRRREGDERGSNN